MARTKGCAPGKKKRKPGMLKDMTIDEVSFVPAGMNQLAHMSILKTEDRKEVIKRMFDEIFAQYQMRDEERQFARDLYMASEAFEESSEEILYNSTIADKKAALTENLNQFVQTFASMVNQSDVIKSAADLGSYLVDIQKPQQEVEDVKKGMSYFVALSVLTDVQKSAFIAMSEKDQEALVKSAVSEDGKELDQEVLVKGIVEPKKVEKIDSGDEETITVKGATVKKSVIGDDAFLVMKGLADEVEVGKAKTEAAEGIAKEERAKRVEKEMADDAEARWPHLPGTPLAKGKMLKGILDMTDESAREQALKGLDSGNAGNADLFVNKGHGVKPSAETPAGQLDAMAKKYQEESTVEGLTFAKAYTLVLDTPEGKALYDQTIQ